MNPSAFPEDSMIRIIVYTDEPILAHGLAGVLSAAPGLDMREVCPTMDAVRQRAGEADVLLMQLTSDVTFAFLSELRRSAPECKIVLWVHTISTELAFQAMGLGIRGILRRTLGQDLIVKCLQKVHQGELWFEKALTDSFLFSTRIPLTRREGQLVLLLSQGMKNKEIAAHLLITEGTVKVYLSKLFQKVGVKDRFELALYALKNLTAEQGPPAQPPQGLSHMPGLRSLVLDRPRQTPVGLMT
jgi:DNA-binding NarL/FixJ family response regulator